MWKGLLVYLAALQMKSTLCSITFHFFETHSFGDQGFLCVWQITPLISKLFVKAYNKHQDCRKSRTFSRWRCKKLLMPDLLALLKQEKRCYYTAVFFLALSPDLEHGLTSNLYNFATFYGLNSITA